MCQTATLALLTAVGGCWQASLENAALVVALGRAGAPPPAGMSKCQVALQDAMSALEEEVDRGGVNGGAHVRLSGCLKRVYDASDGSKKRHIRGYLIETLAEDPFGAASVPCKYRDIIEDEAFLRELIHAKRNEGAPISADWWAHLMEALLPGWMLEHPDDEAIRSSFRRLLIILLRVRWHTLEPLEAHLDKLGVVPSQLFPVYDDDDAAWDDEDTWALVWEALRADARFICWLLKGADKGGYSPAHRAELRECAFDSADKMARDDPRWLRALGLRNIMEYMGCERIRTLGVSFADAKAMQQR